MLDGGAGVSPAEFITERYRNQMLKQADAHEIAEQLIELGEARSTMCDAILSADRNAGGFRFPMGGEAVVIRVEGEV